jgi:hypothetical protein
MSDSKGKGKMYMSVYLSIGWDIQEQQSPSGNPRVSPWVIGYTGKVLASFNMKNRHVTCFVEKAGFEPRTLGTKRSAMTTVLHARLDILA